MSDRLPRVSNICVKLFAAYSKGLLLRRFHGIRILKNGFPPSCPGHSFVIYLNHPSWWDPLVCLYLSRKLFHQYTSFGPIDRKALGRYGFFKRLGFYGVEQQSIGGALAFVRTTSAILESSNHLVWLTPQGRFADVRERPVRLQNGIGAIATQVEHAAFLPLAIEYSYWSEPRPEILVSFGQSIILNQNASDTVEGWTRCLSESLEAVQDNLAFHACRRERDDWELLDRGASGVHSVYDAWGWFRSKLSGHRFQKEHQPENPK